MLYRALAPLGYKPTDIDRLELWQAAVLLGVDEEKEEFDDERFVGTFAGRPITEADKRRLEKFGGATPDDTDITNQVMAEMGIRTH